MRSIKDKQNVKGLRKVIHFTFLLAFTLAYSVWSDLYMFCLRTSKGTLRHLRGNSQTLMLELKVQIICTQKL